MRKLWAVIGTAPDDGVWAFQNEDVWYPMVTLTKTLVPRLTAKAEEISRSLGKSYTLAEFVETKEE